MPQGCAVGRRVLHFIKGNYLSWSVAGEGHKEAKQRVKQQQLAGVSKVVGLSKLKTKYEAPEAKRQLCSLYDLFLADERILPSLPKAIGKPIFTLAAAKHESKRLGKPIHSVVCCRKDFLPEKEAANSSQFDRDELGTADSEGNGMHLHVSPSWQQHDDKVNLTTLTHVQLLHLPNEEDLVKLMLIQAGATS